MEDGCIYDRRHRRRRRRAPAAAVPRRHARGPGRDWVVPQYRELPAMLRQGYDLRRALRYFVGDPAGNDMGEGVRVLPYQISLAAQMPHAVGLAWGLRHQGLDGVVLVFFGEGASSEGDAHEAMNLAGVRRAPVIFLLKNNGWAISTPVSKQTAAASLAARASGLGFPGELVDGNDLFAVHDATARGLVDAASEEALRAQVEAEIDAAMADVEGGPAPGVNAVFDHVYANPPPRVIEQRAAATGEG